jgi:YjbE family integral membrane protein
LDRHFLLNALTIVAIDLILSGDNGVVIAMAVRSLPKKLRVRAIGLGAFLAVMLRVVATFFASRMLQIPFIQMTGGLFIFWIAVKLFSDADSEAAPGAEIRNFWKAIWYILVADITMSADNILAVAATAKSSLPLLLFGLGLSIPFVVCASSFLSLLMDRFPVVVYAGAAILGKVGAQMILTDPYTAQGFHPSDLFRYCIEAASAISVVLIGIYMRRRAPSLLN